MNKKSQRSVLEFSQQLENIDLNNHLDLSEQKIQESAFCGNTMKVQKIMTFPKCVVLKIK